ncbi:MAG: hypothetical protein QXU44_01980 [Candidatus Caldarchaeum sp.]
MKKIVSGRDEAVKFLKNFARDHGLHFSLVDDVRTVEFGHIYDKPPAPDVVRKTVYQWKIVTDEAEQKIWVEIEKIE